MPDPIPFKTAMEFAYGAPKALAPDIVRVVANNPGPFTFKGTNTYVVGTSTLAIIDPGPDDDAHLSAILTVAAGRPVSHILITHTHRDHIDLLVKLARATGATIAGYGRAGLATPKALATPTGQEFVDLAFTPDIELRDGDAVSGPGWSLKAIFTPGHAPDHLCFALEDRRILFSGDHVMAWNTSVVAPPEGSMGAYYASLDRLTGDDFDVFMPGHGGRLEQPQRMVKAFLVHRRWREQAILGAVRDGAGTIEAIAGLVYRGLDPRLSTAAKLSVQAHVEHLIDRGLVASAGPLTFDQRLWAVSVPPASPAP